MSKDNIVESRWAKTRRVAGIFGEVISALWVPVLLVSGVLGVMGWAVKMAWSDSQRTERLKDNAKISIKNNVDQMCMPAGCLDRFDVMLDDKYRVVLTQNMLVPLVNKEGNMEMSVQGVMVIRNNASGKDITDPARYIVPTSIRPAVQVPAKHSAAIPQ